MKEDGGCYSHKCAISSVYPPTHPSEAEIGVEAGGADGVCHVPQADGLVGGHGEQEAALRVCPRPLLLTT